MIIRPDEIKSYPKIIGIIKSSFTKLAGIKYSKNANREANIWQRRFWEHTIRDENDLYKHFGYIHYNSVKHYEIAPRDWNYSSFNKFVKMGYYEKDWCNLEDKYKINEMDCE